TILVSSHACELCRAPSASFRAHGHASVQRPTRAQTVEHCMATHIRNWAALGVLALAGAPFSADADPARPPVALVVDVAGVRLPDDVHIGAQKRVEFQGFPVLIGSGPSTNVGLAANHRLALDPHLTIDSDGSIGRTRIDSFVGGPLSGTERGNGRTTLRYEGDWLDLAATPGATAEGPERGMALAYTLENRAAIRAPFGWELAAASHHGQRDAAMAEGPAGSDGSRQVTLSHRAASGSTLGVGYSYGWSSPESAAVSSERQVAVSANFAFMADVNCSAEYRQGLSAGAGQDLALGMDWDLRSDGFAAANLKADLGLKRSDPEAAPDALSGTANLSLAMKF